MEDNLDQCDAHHTQGRATTLPRGWSSQTDQQIQHNLMRNPNKCFWDTNKFILKFIWEVKGSTWVEAVLAEEHLEDSHYLISRLNLKRQ